MAFAHLLCFACLARVAAALTPVEDQMMKVQASGRVKSVVRSVEARVEASGQIKRIKSASVTPLEDQMMKVQASGRVKPVVRKVRTEGRQGRDPEGRWTGVEPYIHVLRHAPNGPLCV